MGATSAVGGFHLQQTASFLNGLPPDFYGLEDWNEDAMLSQVRRTKKTTVFHNFQRVIRIPSFDLNPTPFRCSLPVSRSTLTASKGPPRRRGRAATASDNLIINI